MGGPANLRLKVEGNEYIRLAVASFPPAATSANTNAPPLRNVWKGAEFIAEDAA